MIRVQFKPNLIAIANIGGNCDNCSFSGRNKKSVCDTIKARSVDCGEKVSWYFDDKGVKTTPIYWDDFGVSMLLELPESE